MPQIDHAPWWREPFSIDIEIDRAAVECFDQSPSAVDRIEQPVDYKFLLPECCLTAKLQMSGSVA